jgi:hypothetical protein
MQVIFRTELTRRRPTIYSHVQGVSRTVLVGKAVYSARGKSRSPTGSSNPTVNQVVEVIAANLARLRPDRDH